MVFDEDNTQSSNEQHDRQPHPALLLVGGPVLAVSKHRVGFLLQHFETNSRTTPFFRHSYIETNDSGREWHGKAIIWPERANGPRSSYLAGNSTRVAPSELLIRRAVGGTPGVRRVQEDCSTARSLRPGTSAKSN